MALAYLCSRVHRQYHALKIADNPISIFYCVVVDHRLRDGSNQEARAVVDVLANQLRLRKRFLEVSWVDALRATGCAHPTELPNLETIARRLRYRAIGQHFSQFNMGSLLLAHHEDDQYETVLMRLLSGHGAAGLRGMRTASHLPECHDIHGAGQSGFLDDQVLEAPMINYRPTYSAMRRMHREMVEDVDPELMRRELNEGGRADAYSEDEMDSYVPRTLWMLPAPPPEVEDGGIMIYRPLLSFGKDRLIATCEANGVPWFEDATNSDSTLTMRNAVRHLYKNHTLPVALQKSAVLEMSRRLQRKAASDDLEVDRLLVRTVVKDFESTSGTVVVQLPRFHIPRLRGGQGREVRRTKRLEHYRHIASLLLKRLIEIVTPQPPGAITSNLHNTILHLFPSLNDDPSAYPRHPKAFNIAGVHFLPVRRSSRPGGPLQWYLSREPYVSDRPLPACFYHRLPFSYRHRRRAEQWRWPLWRAWELWDGRFWVKVCNRSPVHAAVAPFEARYAKAFRNALPDAESRDQLMALLRLHAPGKVRYTLPAIYTAGSIEQAVRDYDGADAAEQKRAEVEARKQQVEGGSEQESEQEESQRNGFLEWSSGITAAADEGRELVALPTLGIARPGLQNWIAYKVRYKRVDKKLLENSARGEEELEHHERARRKAKGRGVRRWQERSALRRKRPGMKTRGRAKKAEMKRA